MKPKDFLPLLQKSFTSWGEDKASRLAASLSYFTVFSLAPLLIVAIGIASMAFRALGQNDAVQDQVLQQLADTVGKPVATSIQQLLENANTGGGDSRPILATIFGFATSLFGASGLFAALQDSLNTIWGVQPKPNAGILATVRDRFISFAMVLGIGFLLLVSLMLSTGLQAMTSWMNSHLGEVAFIGQVLNIFIGFFVVLLLFAAIYKILPDAKIQWRDVWIGAAVTSFLFSVGRFALGWYLAKPSVSSAYGSAGALVVLLLWVYYAAQIMFFGAEFTKVYANEFGSKIVPDDNAIATSPEARSQQGLSPTQAHGEMVKAPGNTSDGVKKPVPAMSEASRAEQQKNFEFTLATVAGGILMTLWLFRRKS